ncbi:ribonuclease H-like domain-containing protein [Sporolactobacillus terrae]|uniref:YprB ribonuclease H-like domain-containing protein n=1 Tax=Sporolactobacillus terrae TaxID=269673 RepID=A0A5K7WX28_9BACL|nr:ribonuclease H-like domain-containing protein [Sporolactobacillus terrae]BBN98832.1 hypothetical protein St703_15370 [Sporolactobacillus terrae]
MSLAQKLKLYRKQLHEQNRGAQESSLNRQQQDQMLNDERQNQAIRRAATALAADLRTFEDQYVLVHSERLPLATRIGPYALGDLWQTVASWQAFDAAHPLSAKGLHAEDLLFFDTETTGLGSGSGQMIFLIGLARMTDHFLELKQYFLPGPGHEAAFYDSFLKDCTSLKHLVTFNGKAFDWPRVKTRHQFVRDQVPKLPAFGHFDLLHASRRLWKNRLESVRLQSIESKLLSMNRENDVPGKLAPFLYFQFLKHPEPGLVKGIIEHNREDVLTLVSLYIHLSNKILGKAAADPEENYEIARWFEQIGDHAHAQTIWKTLIQKDSAFQIPAKARLAACLKRKGDYRQSLKLFESVIAAGEDEGGLISIEAAKLLEHRFHDYSRAIQYTKSAMIQIGHQQNDEKLYQYKKAACLKRLNRLNLKRAKKFS